MSADPRRVFVCACALSIACWAASAAPVLAADADGFVELIDDPARVLSVPLLPRPGYLQTVEDTLMGTRVTRITGDPSSSLEFGPGASSGTASWGADARHHLYTNQPWSSDGKLIAIQNRVGSPTQLFLDGETYEVVSGRCPGYSGDDRWHPSRDHASERIVADGRDLMWYDVVRCVQTRSWTLPIPVDGIGPSYGNPSADGRFIALTDGRRAFVVDMDPQAPLEAYPAERIGPVRDILDCELPNGCKVSWVSIAPSGRYVVAEYAGGGARVFDVDPGTLALTPRAMPESAPRCGGATAASGFIYDVEMGDLARNPFDGDEDVLIGRENCGNRGKRVDGQLMGGFVMVRLRDGAVTSLTDPTNEAYPHMVSARNDHRPGWVYATYYNAQDGKRFNDEIVAIKLDGSFSVQRFGHRRSVYKNCYRCTPHPVPSRDGRRVLWASNWVEDCTDCGESGTISAFVVDARATEPPNQAPEGVITSPLSDVTIREGESIVFAASGMDPDGHLPLEFAWSFGGGAPDQTAETPGAVTFATPGVYTVTLTVSDARGLADPTPGTIAVTVRANEPPNGEIAALPESTTLIAGDALAFAATGTDPEDDLPLAFAWTFGGAAPDTTAQDAGAIVFGVPGTYTVTLTAADARGAADPTPDSMTVLVVANEPPDGEIAEHPAGTTIFAGDTLTFAGTGVDPDGHLPLAFAWSFGGAAPDAAVQDPGAIAFDTPGAYVVTLTVTDARGLADPTPDSVTVNVVTNQAPDGEIVGIPADTTIVTGDTLTFAGTGTDPDGHLPLAFAWGFGGAAPDVAVQDPGAIAFDTPGAYVVTLTVTDARGLADATPDTSTITVSERPANTAPRGEIADMPADTTIVAGTPLTFAAIGSDDDGDLPLAFSWTFGGAAADGPGDTPGVVWFETPGSYVVTLTATDARGLADPTPDTLVVTVTETPANVPAFEVHWTFTGPTSVTVNWREGMDFVRVGSAAGRYDRRIVATPPPPPQPFSSAGPFREAAIDGLEPGTEYHYSIGYGSDHVFHTPPAPGPTEFTIYVAGDIGSTIGFPRSIPGIYRLVAEGQPKFFLALGDLTYGNPHGQAAVERHFDDMMVWSQDAAFMPIWGNHEWDKPEHDDLRNYKGRFALPNAQTSPGSPAVSCCGEDWYWFDYGHVRFIGLPEPWPGAFFDWNQKADALMADAQSNPDLRFIVTFGHRPAYSSGSKSSHMTLRGYLNALGTRYPKYKLDLSGHAHHYERSHPQHGVTHVLAGGGGAGLQGEDRTCRYRGGCPAPAWSAYRALRHSVVRLTFSADAIDGWAICGPADEEDNDISCGVGTPFDQFRIGEGAPPDTSFPIVNLAPNPSFEQTLEGWNPYGRTTLSRVQAGFDGDWAGEAIPTDDSGDWFGFNDAPNIVTVSDSAVAHYHFSAWVRAAEGAGLARLRVREYLAGRLVGTTVNATRDLSPEWQPLGLAYPAPLPGSTLDLQVLFRATGPGGRFLADEVVVEVNGGFEEEGGPPTAGRADPAAAAAEHVHEEAAVPPLRFEASLRPMPLRGTGLLRLATTRAGVVDASLFDVNGRRVRILADRVPLEAGIHELAVDGRDQSGSRLAPGVYLYRVHSSEGTLTGRCVIMP